jgi:hypothetical protein
MRFDSWMELTGSTNAAFGARVRKTGETVRRWRAGEREPEFEDMRRVFKLSDGAVTPNDWVGIGPRSAEEGAVTRKQSRAVSVA